jgi:hypothetical protein
MRPTSALRASMTCFAARRAYAAVSGRPAARRVPHLHGRIGARLAIVVGGAISRRGFLRSASWPQSTLDLGASAEFSLRRTRSTGPAGCSQSRRPVFRYRPKSLPDPVPAPRCDRGSPWRYFIAPDDALWSRQWRMRCISSKITSEFRGLHEGIPLTRKRAPETFSVGAYGA